MSPDTLDTTNVPDFAIKELDSIKAFLLQESINWISYLTKTTPSLRSDPLNKVVEALQKSKNFQKGTKTLLNAKKQPGKDAKSLLLSSESIQKKIEERPYTEEQKRATQFYIKGFRERLEKDLGDQNQLVGLIQDAYKRSILTTAIPTPAQVNNEAPTAHLSKAEVINTLINDITLPPSIHSQNINSIGGWVGSYMLGKLGKNFQELTNYTAENINESLAKYSAAKGLIDKKLGKYSYIEYRAAVEKKSLPLIARRMGSNTLSIVDGEFKINDTAFTQDQKFQAELLKLTEAINSIKPQISFYSICMTALDSVKRAFKREIPAKEVTSAAQPVPQTPVVAATTAAQPVQQGPAAEAQTTTHKKAPPPVAPRPATAGQTTVQEGPTPKKAPPPVAPRPAVADAQPPTPKKEPPPVAPRKRETQKSVKELIEKLQNQSAQLKSSIPGAIKGRQTERSRG